MPVQKGDIGVDFTITLLKASDLTPLDVSSATTLQIKFRPVGGTTRTQTASLVTDGTDGKIRYITASADDLNVSGVNWEIQPYVDAPTFHGHGHKNIIHVEETL